MKKTRIIATIGPATETPESIRQLIEAGVNCFRLNFSFSELEWHRERIRIIRETSRKIGRPVAILQDLQGPKIRIGTLKQPLEVQKDDVITLSGQEEHRIPEVLPTTYPGIAEATRQGDPILIADGSIQMQVIESYPQKDEVRCKVLNGGTIRTGKGINLPSFRLDMPSMTEKDIEDAVAGAHLGVDYIALSFVRSRRDIEALRELLARHDGDIPIIAKIEKPEAVRNIEEVIDQADGIMIARGDLAVELSLARVPLEQKRILRLANEKGKLTIVATEMLQSMVENPLPTRAEANDVANAILDGVDAVMLSAETSIGRHPVQAVRIMSEIAETVEQSQSEQPRNSELRLPPEDLLRYAMCAAVSNLSYHLDEEAVLVFSDTGNTVRILSKYRPESPIIAITSNERLANRMAFYHNSVPVLLSENITGRLDLAKVKDELSRRGLIREGNQLIVLSGQQEKTGWQAQTITIEQVEHGS